MGLALALAGMDLITDLTRAGLSAAQVVDVDAHNRF